MIQFKAPLQDINFLINDVFDFQSHYKDIPGGDEATPDMVDAILGEAARFSEEVLSPLYQVGDKEGCKFEDGKVTTPPGFKEAYQQYMEGGWQGMTSPVDYGGQGLPQSLGLIKSELIGTANWVWGMYPGLSQGAMNVVTLPSSNLQPSLSPT